MTHIADRDIPHVDRILSCEDDLEQFAIAVDIVLQANGQPPIDDEEAQHLLQDGWTADAAAALIIAARHGVTR